MEITKLCSECEEEKSVNEFHNNKKNKDGLDYWCKACRKKYQQNNREKKFAYGRRYRQKNKERLAVQKLAYYQKNRAQILMKKKKYYQENRDMMVNGELLRSYGITTAQKAERIRSQNGKCAICEKELDMGRNTHVDHDHKTGKVRGILCDNCNKALGHIKDDLIIAGRLQGYLIYYNQKERSN